jgi:hypothetical protein
MKACLWLMLAPWLMAQPETLRYSINWPSGLSLGEATLTANGGMLSLTLEAMVPGFPIRDQYSSRVGARYCSETFSKEFVHGARKGLERLEFDAARKVVVRETPGGGKSEIPFPAACPKDALAFLFFLREELKNGRLPAAQTLFFGAPYQVRLTYAGGEKVKAGEQWEDTDRVQATVKGPASETSIEILFARDQARTPVLVRVRLAMGTFSMELARE